MGGSPTYKPFWIIINVLDRGDVDVVLSSFNPVGGFDNAEHVGEVVEMLNDIFPGKGYDYIDSYDLNDYQEQFGRFPKRIFNKEEIK